MPSNGKNQWPPWLLTELVTVARPYGVWNGKVSPHVKFLNDWPSSTLTWSTPTHLKRALAAIGRWLITLALSSKRKDQQYQIKQQTRREPVPKWVPDEPYNKAWRCATTKLGRGSLWGIPIPQITRLWYSVVKFLLLLLNELWDSVKTLISIVICWFYSDFLHFPYQLFIFINAISGVTLCGAWKWTQMAV